jgi:hypothetical protein
MNGENWLLLGLYLNECVLLFKATQCYNYLMRMPYFTKQSRYYSRMFEQLIELSLVEIELPSKTLLHCVIMNGNTHWLG